MDSPPFLEITLFPIFVVFSIRNERKILCAPAALCLSHNSQTQPFNSHRNHNEILRFSFFFLFGFAHQRTNPIPCEIRTKIMLPKLFLVFTYRTIAFVYTGDKAHRIFDYQCLCEYNFVLDGVRQTHTHFWLLITTKLTLIRDELRFISC